jgi:hypothetical protein
MNEFAHAIGKWIEGIFKSELQAGANNVVQAFMNAHPVITGIAGIVFAGGLILLAILVVAVLVKSWWKKPA